VLDVGGRAAGGAGRGDSVNPQPLTYGSVCSGIEAASVAWEPLGWRAAFFSEIATFPRAVLSHRFPGVPLRGDFTEIREGDHAAIDLLVGGTPCQSFSVAGLRGGLDDDRGQLALEYLRLADRLRPRWLVWENVPGVLSANGGRALGAFFGGLAELGYGWAWRVLDAQYFGLAQRRQRVFVVACAGGARGRAAAVLLERASLRGDPAPSRAAGEDASRCLTTGTGRRYDAEPSEDLIALPLAGHHPRHDLDHETYATYTPRQHPRPGSNSVGAIAFDLNQCTNPTHRRQPGPLSGALSLSGREAVAYVSGDITHPLGAKDSGHGLALPSGVRRLTPRECERLQGFDDDWTLVPYGKRGRPAKDGPRYKAIGNSMAVPVMRWIGKRIAAVEAL
jgi:DNA (cytosine-5)-methyltransferase 1